MKLKFECDNCGQAMDIELQEGHRVVTVKPCISCEKAIKENLADYISTEGSILTIGEGGD